MPTRHFPDVVVIGAGIVGAACAYYASRSGLAVTVVDRGPVAGGTTGAGEGNLLVSDKGAGPELDLALLSTRLWRELAQVLPPETEYEPKGGLVVTPDEAAFAALRTFANGQRAAGVEACEIPADRLQDLEPHLAPGLAGGLHYPQDAQVQPARATAQLLRSAAGSGAEIRLGEDVTAILTGPRGEVRGVRTPAGDLLAPAVVNAAGTWGGHIAGLAGTELPVLPRRGFVLVTEPLPRVVRHKVYAADYIADVASGSAALQSSAVVEGTPAGPVLIGATRERVGFDRTLSTEALRRLAAQAAALFPVLADVRVMRTYHGFRPYLPDHLPAIGPDPRVPGLFHACGHEGAGIGLAPATGLLIAAALRGETPVLDLHPFRPERFPGPDRQGADR
ncbi:FAD-dependent oxidoreductase [Streptomyces agglomeratus]|uniref:NAD(P)/FAD-dependent oxidoreductase n=1 Tax=Streptomyces agglomeratus TaxID=285458 RepID=UPI0008524F18|nr:FAD-dependent oxidoreductase [Streptomyces agglomeratus]OEJ37367.1 FAD-dependent oxidoreductase [Streptomyces agglomeratus]OEJ48250.1 FAD-dependent oxidoreductase [Streptomyces agglomeratus]OEJ57236.1 FAD-dependent oxidoreductase [Streptomyces agglomeratus]